MAEWSIAAVLKTVDLHGSGGSNPSLSAQRRGRRQTERSAFLYLCALRSPSRSLSAAMLRGWMNPKQNADEYLTHPRSVSIRLL